MKFLVDAQLPRRLAHWLQHAGHDALPTLDLPDGNRTTDAEINALAVRDGRTVVRLFRPATLRTTIWRRSALPTTP